MNDGRKVLLVGSVPLDSAEAVFEAASGIMGEQLRYLPDGETGERKNWIGWQYKVLSRAAFLHPAQRGQEYGGANSARLELSRPVQDGDAFGELGYAAAAISSYAKFRQMRNEGRIAAHLRFQVSLPTPVAPLTSFIAPGDFAAVEPLYTVALQDELRRMLASIPASDLAIQWDTAIEFALLEGVMPGPINQVSDVAGRLAELAGWIPAEVSLGFHFCYGDAGHKHFREPSDTALLVRVANALFAAIPRRLDWLHFPVPRDRDDPAYFAPLADLRLLEGCELFLGLVHMTDGPEGAKRRIAAATPFADAFGVATECGWGRRPPEDVPALMQLNAAVARQGVN